VVVEVVWEFLLLLLTFGLVEVVEPGAVLRAVVAHQSAALEQQTKDMRVEMEALVAGRVAVVVLVQ
jgi:hypothetical protein